MADRHRIYLVPGFFGFVNLGQLVYFSHVRQFMGQALRELGLEAEVHEVVTEPTASIPTRAVRLLEAMARGEQEAPVHVVGHSTGGLDARLLLTPGVALPTDLPVEDLVRQVRTVVTVSTPHHGTPLASFFSTIYGKKLLRVLSLLTIYVLRFGRLPLSVLLRLGALFVRLDDHLGWRDTVADQVYELLLGDFTPERREAVESFMARASEDQTLMGQLTPEGIELFNASTTNRTGVCYGSVVTVVDPPGIGSALRLGLEPYAQATHGLFTALYKITARTNPLHLHTPEEEQLLLLREALGRALNPEDNDGIVPGLSQVWGELICAARADHLDVIGHFRSQPPTREPPHSDWFSSGSGFTRSGFDALWRQVAGFIAGANRPAP